MKIKSLDINGVMVNVADIVGVSRVFEVDVRVTPDDKLLTTFARFWVTTKDGTSHLFTTGWNRIADPLPGHSLGFNHLTKVSAMAKMKQRKKWIELMLVGPALQEVFDRQFGTMASA